MDKKFVKIFTYGTLKRDFWNNRILEEIGARFIDEARTAKGFRLFKNSTIPFMCRDSHSNYQISGEIFEVPAEELHTIDSLEGHPHWYKREFIDLEDGSSIEAYLYPLDESLSSSFTDISANGFLKERVERP
jgi:gamma-glutamylaminecyclotransferase